MTEYKVVWEIDLEADDYMTAAVMARTIMFEQSQAAIGQDDEVTAPAFYISTSEVSVLVDLETDTVTPHGQCPVCTEYYSDEENGCDTCNELLGIEKLCPHGTLHGQFGIVCKDCCIDELKFDLEQARGRADELYGQLMDQQAMPDDPGPHPWESND